MQPCDQGIIKTLKIYNRKSIKAFFEILTVELNQQISRLLYLMAFRWPEILGLWFHHLHLPTALEEQNLFHHLRIFERVVESESVSSFETYLQVHCTFEEYVSSDNHLQCSPMLSSADIVASLGQNTEDAEDSEMKQGILFSHYCSSSSFWFLRYEGLPAMLLCREW